MQRAVNRLARSGEALAAGDLTTVAATVTCAHALVRIHSAASVSLGRWDKGSSAVPLHAPAAGMCLPVHSRAHPLPARTGTSRSINSLALDELPGLVQP